ncbi:hypothetical protein EVAR_60632_1 [Eumeta japonica]|uniref:Uncharacterized protein n=1 Tax=Eumeta variegata TaxID=151549 RepID=A0A4C2AA26_EUMVA|nr:hypothetical protein EVAR_60632_1 [Eumeta japonica]
MIDTTSPSACARYVGSPDARRSTREDKYCSAKSEWRDIHMFVNLQAQVTRYPRIGPLQQRCINVLLISGYSGSSPPPWVSLFTSVNVFE